MFALYFYSIWICAAFLSVFMMGFLPNVICLSKLGMVGAVSARLSYSSAAGNPHFYLQARNLALAR